MPWLQVRDREREKATKREESRRAEILRQERDRLLTEAAEVKSFLAPGTLTEEDVQRMRLKGLAF